MQLSFKASLITALFGAVLLAQHSEAAHLKGSVSDHVDEKIHGGKDVERRLVEFAIDPALEEKPICIENIFQPDTSKYYTIGTSNGLVWSAGSDGGGKAFDRGITLTSQTTAASSHWRFISGGGGRWQLRNRMTGMILDRDSVYKNLETMNGGKTVTDFRVRGECVSSDEVIFSRDGNSNEAAFCTSNNCGVGTSITVATPVVVGSKKSSCRFPRFLDSCDGYFKTSSAPIWRQSEYGRCGWRNKKRFRRCEQIEMRALSTDPEESWVVSPVTEFAKPDTKAAPVVSILEDNVESITDDLVQVGLSIAIFISGKITLGGSAAFGAFLGLTGIQQQVGGDSEAALAQLTAEILEAVDNRINQAVVKSDLEQAANLLDVARKRFLISYVAEKKSRFDTNGQPLNQGELLGLSEDLQDYGNDYIDAMATLFAGPGDFSPTDINALRGQNAWSIMKLAMIEVLTLYQEAVALDAYISTAFDDLDFTCDDIYNGHFSLGPLVSDLRDKLVKTRDMIVNYRTNINTLQFVTKDRRCQACTVDGCYPYTCGTERVAVKDDLRQVQFDYESALRDRWIAELRFDMIHLSYPMEKELEFFDTYEANTMLLCETMMNNSTLQDLFAAA